MPEPTIRVGIGGWDYEGWRGTFYPPGLPKTQQLAFAAQRLTAIEVNATFYKLQSPALFAKWRDAVSEGFRFALKGSRFCTNRKLLAEAGEAVARFCGQGLVELGDRLGPILWQFAATKRFDPDDVRAFLDLLPRAQDGVPLTHVVEAEHESFRDPAFVDLARTAGVGICIVEGEAGFGPGDLAGSVAYLRLKGSRAEEPLGYAQGALAERVGIAQALARGDAPLSTVAPPEPARARDTYLFFIAGAKARNPAAAMRALEMLAKPTIRSP